MLMTVLSSPFATSRLKPQVAWPMPSISTKYRQSRSAEAVLPLPEKFLLRVAVSLGDCYLDADNYSFCLLFVPVSQDTVYCSKIEIGRRKWGHACVEYRMCLCHPELSAGGQTTFNDNVFEYEVPNIEPQNGGFYR